MVSWIVGASINTTTKAGNIVHFTNGLNSILDLINPLLLCPQIIKPDTLIAGAKLLSAAFFFFIFNDIQSGCDPVDYNACVER